MSSKSGSEPRTWSISRRLILLYCISSFTLLLVGDIILYRSLSRTVSNLSARYISGELALVKTLVRTHNFVELAEEIEDTNRTVTFAPRYVRIISGEGDVFIETAGMKREVPSLPFPPRNTGADGVWTSPSGKKFLLASSVEKGLSKEDVIVEVALDITSLNAPAGDGRKIFVIVVAVMAVISAAAAVLLTSAGLRPLKEIASTAREVTALNLTGRLDGKKWPREVEPLVSEFNAMLDRLENSFKRLSDFSANIAHEIRTPVTNLMGEAEIALYHDRSPEEYRAVLESAIEEYRRLSRMIEGLLFLARARSGLIRLEPEDVDVAGEAENVVDFFSAVAEEKAVSLRCTGEGKVRADRMLLRRCLANIISNGVTFTPSGGTVTVCVGHRGDFVVVTVSDTGCGISREKIASIADPFFRIDGTRRMKPSGSGFGLAVAKEIVVLHGGELVISSSEAGGATVTVTFPASVPV